MLENATVSVAERAPFARTGMTVVFVTMGQDVRIKGSSLKMPSTRVRQMHEGYLRKSVVSPFERENTGDNTPAVIHCEIARDTFGITVSPRVWEREQKCVAYAHPAGIEGVKRFVIIR